MANRNLMYGVAALVVVVAVLGVLYYNGSLSGYSNPYSTSSSSMVYTTSTSSAAASYSVGTSSSSTLGSYLVDGNGKTLYYFTKDIVGNSTSDPVSACTAGCLSVWPVFYASSVTVPSGLNANDFTTFTRSDGAMQTAYKGMPLYYYASDTNPGDTNGQGVNNFWFVVAP